MRLLPLSCSLSHWATRRGAGARARRRLRPPAARPGRRRAAGARRPLRAATLDPDALASARTVPQLIAQLRDPFTSYLTSAQYAALQGRHRRRASTASACACARRARCCASSSVVPKSPAARAGLRKGDTLLSVDGLRVRGHLDTALRGAAGAAPRAAEAASRSAGAVTRTPCKCQRARSCPACGARQRRGEGHRARDPHPALLARRRGGRAPRRARCARSWCSICAAIPAASISEAEETVDVFLDARPHRLVLGRAHDRQDVVRGARAPRCRACRSSSSSTARPRAPPRSSLRPCATTSAPRSSARGRSGRPRSRRSSPVAGGGAVKLTVADVPHAQRARHPRPRRPPGRARADTAARARRRRGTSACERRGRRAAARRLHRRAARALPRRAAVLRRGQQLALGRRSGQAVQAGELVVVEHAGGSARVVERLGSPDRRRPRAARRCCCSAGSRASGRRRALREARRASRAAPSRTAAQRTCSSSRRSRSTRRPRATSTTRSASSRTATASARWVHIADVASYVKPGRRARRRGGPPHLQRVRARDGRADAPARALGRRLQPAAGRGAARASASRCASAPTASRARRTCAAR